MRFYTLDELMNEKPVIINPAAGSDSKIFENSLRKRLDDEHFHYLETKAKGDAGRLLSEWIAVAEKEDKMVMVLVVGGDGTYNDAINAEGDLRRIIFVPIPGGTSSDITKSLHLDNTARTCNLLNKIFDGEEDINDYANPMDLIKVNYDEGKEVKAINLFSVGFDGLLCKEVNESRRKGGFGKKNVFLSKMVDIIRNKRYDPIQIAYTINDDHSLSAVTNDVLMFTIINTRYAGSGINYNPEFSINDGSLEGFLVKNMTKKEVSKLVWHVAIKKDDEHINSPRDNDGFNRFKVNYIPGIKSAMINILRTKDSQEYYFQVDGEHHRIERPSSAIKIDVLPRATNVLYLPN